jgi:excinuclease ABC subunit A
MIRLRDAHQNNLKHISLEIPHHQLIVVTGVSGSGKSSLAFDIIAKEGQRRYLETFSTFSRQFMGKISRPRVEYIEGLEPVITLSQRTIGSSSRSTVGTMSDLYDMLRLLFARLGEADQKIALSRSLFSFNTDIGACPVCKGLGLEEKISLEKLVTHPEKSIRDGALSPTQPNGYIMYSQVTVDVLNQVCQAHGFTTDIPWNQLTQDQQGVILYGSTLIKIPFGKHPLESRLRWTGITAKPREEGYYRGLIPIMSEILQRDRNDSILRFVESVPCGGCKGKRLNDSALSVTFHGKTIDQICSLELTDLKQWLESQQWNDTEVAVARPVANKMTEQIGMMINLGIGHLSIERHASSLSGGESQRIRLVNQVYAELSNILYVFDEPTIGLHPAEKKPMLEILQRLVSNGNTVIVVEHDETTIRQADWIIDIGPGAGVKGGYLIFNGKFSDYMTDETLSGNSPTWDSLHRNHPDKLPESPVRNGFLELKNCRVNNLKGFDVRFYTGRINAVTGVSGSGKASLVFRTLENLLQKRIVEGTLAAAPCKGSPGIDTIDKIITIDQSPIGRTPRSNPATYTGLADKIRDLFAKLPDSRSSGFTKTHFSFNTPGGRCETCQGAGSQQIGMHFLGNVDVACSACNGKRFHDEVLKILYRGKNIAEVLELSVDEAFAFFKDQPAISGYLKTLTEIGLGYIHLGQSSSTLSGGEAQRIKLATELLQPDTGNTLYIFDEPTVGLHTADIEILVMAFRRLCNKGNTVVCIEHDMEILRNADHIVELGPQSGKNGGYLLFQGTLTGMMRSSDSVLADCLRKESFPVMKEDQQTEPLQNIELKGITTHNLKNVDVTIPKNKLTVITGISGSGKSSLAFDTLYSEARNRYIESLSSYTRSLLQQSNPAEIMSSKGLGPVVAIGRRYLVNTSRSTVGTLSGLNDLYRLLYSRIAQAEGLNYSSRDFSFNNESGACPDCHGLGYQLHCVAHKLITHPENSIVEGAMKGHKIGLFYGDPHGQYIATLKEAARQEGVDITKPWKDLPELSQELILKGTGEKEYDVTWEFKNKTRKGEFKMKSAWPGFFYLIEDEHQRKHLNKNTRDIENLLEETCCPTCLGSRLKPELLKVKLNGFNIATLSAFTIAETLSFFGELRQKEYPSAIHGIINEITPLAVDHLKVMQELGLSYLSPDRSSMSLSGGEGQRLRLAGALSAQLFGVTYVFDEPSIGLHTRDILPVLTVIRRLVSKGNTAVVVEHDREFISQADYIIEMGPGAGQNGGKVMTAGTMDEIQNNPDSLTGSWIRHYSPAKPVGRGVAVDSFGVTGAFEHNLKQINVSFISNGIIALTGVSGSGKSTLMNHVLFESHKRGIPAGCKGFYGLHQFDRLIAVNQQPLGSNALSTPATYTGLMDVLRDLYAGTKEAKQHSFGKNIFSYLSKEGKCPDCNGYGQKKTSMDFMNDIWTLCDTCKGGRFDEKVGKIILYGHTMSDVLKMTVDEASSAFRDADKVLSYLRIMQDVGIGHIVLGQSCETLSGGEAQRLRLVSELIHYRSGKNLYLFDEPTTGLHDLDIQKLMHLFNQLADEGHTLMFIEHNPLLISIANQVITLGLGSGPQGGYLINQ